MRYDEDHRSPDVIDRRGQRGRGGNGLFILLLTLLRSRFGWVGVLIAIVGGVGYLALQSMGVIGENPLSSDRAAPAAAPGDDKLVSFVSFVLDDCQATWTKKMPSYRCDTFSASSL